VGSRDRLLSMAWWQRAGSSRGLSLDKMLFVTVEKVFILWYLVDAFIIILDSLNIVRK